MVSEKFISKVLLIAEAMKDFFDELKLFLVFGSGHVNLLLD